MSLAAYGFLARNGSLPLRGFLLEYGSLSSFGFLGLNGSLSLRGFL